MILWIENKIPSDGVKDECQNGSNLGADDEIESNRIAETYQEERELSDQNEYEGETVECGAGGNERRWVNVEAAFAKAVDITGPPETRAYILCPRGRRYCDDVESKRGENEQKHENEPDFKQRERHFFRGELCCVVLFKRVRCMN